ncbi:hypothetical protein A7985_01370 [Pseudoalteromonas luteoviolacea]|uniref:SDR family NAD(P)-dependent oxidoreductase n=1 Tax=Pseudoalteromonas luteoviolacea TaxID=43657 RepID=A0A1C0TTJ0_9GAMM|nr:SDR family NAD(P)-dependent oxidoreductase [Pseudoalteromonas luteoviolacea]OCQ22643.1 hypothetical protein A7985_01370 [Pseudoalteromonas luteoviolacea]
MNNKAIIIGATSGIGRALAKYMDRCGYELALTGRRQELLVSLQNELTQPCYIAKMDVSQPHDAVREFESLLTQMQDVELVIINAGTGNGDASFPLQGELDTAAVNVTGFTAIANSAFHFFAKQNRGHLVATSSVMALRGGPCASYNASKAYIATYLEGLSCRAAKHGANISFTELRPGFVDTEMAKGEGIFWLASVEKAAQQIFIAIKKKKRVAYITKRWWLISLILKYAPFKVYLRLIGCKKANQR